MKYLFLIVFAFVLVAGCQPQRPNTIIVNPTVEKPPVPKAAPVPPVAPSSAYLKGYRDGYSGTWLAPFRWTLTDDYRNGWQAGAYDRHNNLPSRHPG